MWSSRASNMAPTAASAVRIESRTGARLTREKIPPLAISPPGRRQEPLLYSPSNSESCGGFRLQIASVARDFGAGDSGFVVRADNRPGRCREEGLVASSGATSEEA